MPARWASFELYLNTMSSSTASGAVAPERKTLLQQIHSELSLRSLSKNELLALVLITLCALNLCAAFQYGRVFEGDEIGTLRYLKASPGYILTHFKVHLSMNYFILVEKGIAELCGKADWRLTLLPLAAAVAIIPLTASVALKFTGSARTALIAASLAAFNPYLLSWGPVIRSYSLLVAFSLLAINEFFHWYRQRDWWSGGRCAAAVLSLLLIHLNGVYTVAFLILLLAIETLSQGWSGGRKFVWESRTLWIPLALAALAFTAAYWRLFPEIRKLTTEWGIDTPPTNMDYLPQLFASYLGGGYFAFFVALPLLFGLWSATQERRGLLLLCLAIALGPILMSLRGISIPTWTYARYLIFSLPLLLIFLAEGIDWLTKHLRMPRAAVIAAWGLTAILILGWSRDIYGQFVGRKNFPYARVAEFLHAQLKNGDLVVTDWHYAFTLSQFFDDAKTRILLPQNYFKKIANKLDTPMSDRVFYITGRGSIKDRTIPIQEFRRIEVAILSGKAPRQLLQEWREDLLRRTGGRVSSSFQTDYQVLALIDETIPSGQSPDRWRFLAERCRSQNPSVRYLPLQQLLKSAGP